MAKPSILFISTQLPFPPKSGGTMKSWKYVSDLANRYQLSIACLLKDEDEIYLDEFKESVEVHTLISEKLQVNRNPLNLIRSYFGYPCLNVFRNYSPTFEQKIHSIASDFDTIIVDHYEMFQYLPNGYKGKVVIHTHNAEFMLWQRMGELSKNPLAKLLLKIEANRVKAYEKKIFSESDLVYSTPSDIELYKHNDIEIEKHKCTYHLGNDELLQLPPLSFNETEGALSFMGTLSWEPNIDGLLWFIQKVWPKIIEEKPNIRFYIMGEKGDNRIYEAAKPYQNIIFTGFVKELDSYLKKTTVYIAPLRFGSGMKVKVLEGLYRGVPMVSTSVGAEGLALENGTHILIANESTSFAKACLVLLNDQALWEKLRDNSRVIAREKYRWKPLFEQMDIELKKILP
jgi:glycosyltransferase involved in cell wall biosynthesis